MKGKMIPLFKIHRIAGTVLDKDKAKKSVTILTRNGVVNVKIYGTVFSEYDKQISVKGADGKKHVIEKSIFHRGNKIIVSGIKQGENEFLTKKYKKTPYPLIEWITQINDDGSFEHKSEREII
jgi:DNA polymerase-3 subunit alpha